MGESANPPRSVGRAAWWMLVLAVALGLRVAAAFAVTSYVQAKGKPCVFDDTIIYRDLARTIVAGTPYVVMQWGSPHYALRTPGYPLFLAGCFEAFGEGLLAVRLVQAVLGAVGVWLVARLAGAVFGPSKAPGDSQSSSPLPPGEGPGVRVVAEPIRAQTRNAPGTADDPHPRPLSRGERGDRGEKVALVAAGLAAAHPYLVGMSALVLSEATFLPLMLAGLWGLAVLWRGSGPRRPGLVAIGTGLAMGAAILSRPSWALFVPAILAAWVLGSGGGSRRRAAKGALVVALATACVMAPWWIRTARVTGRFVPTALWVGASLYDGIGPQADGSSRMEFVEAPDVRSLPESEQDAVFRARSSAAFREDPGRIFRLAAVKFGRFWSPWPNADTLQNRGVMGASAAFTLPMFGLIALGIWDRRRDFRALALLAGPLAYFCVLHVVFVSSIRYRVPGELPAMALASLGLIRAWSWARGGRPMGVRRRFRKVLGWGALLVLAVLVGGAIAAYYYVTDSDTLSDAVRREAPRFLPGGHVDVARVRIRPFGGEVIIHQLYVRERDEGSLGPMVAGLERVQVRFDPWAMFKGRFEPREVIVAKPLIRLRRRADGSWNFRGLLADPMPVASGGPMPPITIQEGTIELSEEGSKANLRLLRDVLIKIPATDGSGGPIPFEMAAKGDAGLFERFTLSGSVDPGTGRVDIKAGELVRLTLSEALRGHLPAEARDRLASAGLAGGEVDATLSGLTYDPGASPPLHYRAGAKLRWGLWKCPKLPFPISDISVDVQAVDGVVDVLRAEGSDGVTGLGLKGRVSIDPDDPMKSPFEFRAEATNLELDARIRGWIPARFREIWDAYFPQVGATPTTSAGRISRLSTVVKRPAPGAEVDVVADVDLLDVSMKYKHFPYPVDHVSGKIHTTPGLMHLDVRSLVGNKPIHVYGDVADPGPEAVAHLNFDLESLPIDQALLKALPPEVKKVVDSFSPTGTVRGHAELVRKPPLKKGDDPRGRVNFDAWIDLNDDCSMTWSGLKYPVLNLAGKLEIHPNLWKFRDMRGRNGQAIITAAGEVQQLAKHEFKVDMGLRAENLPFDQQLRDALPPAWQVTWATLNPSGASDIDATIHVDPRKSGRDRQHDLVVIKPRKQAGVKLKFKPLVGAGMVSGGPIELRMDDVSGTFVYDTATSPPTTMTDVKFSFQRAPVTFATGKVDVKDTGEFKLGVSHLEVSKLRLDDELRHYMPPVMAQFSRRLDDLPIPLIRANLGLGWSGKAGESAWCRWDDALVVLSRNRVSVGTDMALEHIEGQLEKVDGYFNGRDLKVHGNLNIESFSVFGQQVSALSARLDVEKGEAWLRDVKARVLGGHLAGHLFATLDSTIRYSARVDVKDANLEEYARTLPGHQSFRGLVSGLIDVSGFGYDPHTISGNGMASIVKGELGTLPIAARFVNVLKLAKDTRTAFDSAEVAFRIEEGETTLDPIRFVGNAFSLDGKGTLDIRGELDMKLRPLPGRDSIRVPLLSDFARELSGQILVVRVHGPAASPNFNLEPIPGPGELYRNQKRNRDIKRTGLVGPWRTGLEPRLRSGLGARWFGPPE